MPKRHQTTWILVCDGAQGRIFANYGPETGLTVVTDAAHPQSQERTKDLGADRPGRSFDSAGSGRHSMVPPVDWHRYEKEKFAQEMATLVNKAVGENRFERLIVVAPPRVLGDLRRALSPQATAKLTGELGKDLTHLNGDAIGDHLHDLVKL